MTNLTPRFVTLGTTDAVNTCERCGRTNLKKAVALAEVGAGDDVTGDPIFVGTSCAASLTGKSASLITRTASKADGQTLVGRFGSWAWTCKGTAITVKNLATSNRHDLADLRPKVAAAIKAQVVAARA